MSKILISEKKLKNMLRFQSEESEAMFDNFLLNANDFIKYLNYYSSLAPKEKQMHKIFTSFLIEKLENVSSLD